MRPIAMSAAVALALAAPMAQADAQSDSLAALRAEVAQMKHAYEQRIAALESRLAQAEAAASPPVALGGAASQPGVRPGEGKTNVFNPEIGLILQGRIRKARDVPERTVSGYWPAGHDHGGEQRGLSLEHSELILSANIDPGFRGVARLAVAPDGQVEVEEASVSTLGLGHGLTVRGGRFASAVGYQNAQHPHEWDFADASLMQKVLFGDEGYRQDGLQLRWLAPTDLFLQLGLEIGRGAGFPGTDRNQNGVGAGALFAKIGGEVGVSHAWQAGLSFLDTRAEHRQGHFEDADPAGPNEVTGLFSGRSRTAIADFVWKWAPNGDARARHVKIQGEIFRRTESGALACAADAATSPCAGGLALGDLSSRQTGGYAQAVWQFMPRWRVGYRHDWLGRGGKSYDAAAVLAALDPGNHYFADHAPRRDSLMVDWSNSEFSRLRLQYARDRSMRELADNQWTLQYIMSLGAHGAHKF